MGLKTAFSYSALESIVSRVFDLLILWVVFNALPTEDVALFGVSTSAIFIFNLFFLTPETSLFKFQKRWKMDGVLYKYLSAFFSFSLIKILLHYLLIGCVYVLYDSTNWFFYAVIYSAIVQQVQISEICRIYFRLELQQRKVAIYELIGKGLLLLLVSFLFVQGSISKYYLIYYGWTCVMAVVWLSELRKFESIRISFGSDTLIKIKDSMFGYSLWTHVVGVMTMFIYNSNVLFLEWLGRPLKDVALFTVVNKVANLFFVLPMFIQSFVPVVLANIKDEEKSKLLKLLLINAIVSVGQFVFFVLFGRELAELFGVSNGDTTVFYDVGLIVSFGIMLLNISRPFSSYLFIRTSASGVMFSVFVPAFIFALVIYPVCIVYRGLYGAAYASFSVYGLIALLLGYRLLKTGAGRL